MRTRLLAAEGALADYEILEMLLFLGIKRRDTKPLAKALINRFGSLHGALTASAEALGAAGLPQEATTALALAVESADLLACPETRAAPALSDWPALERHLGLSEFRPPGVHALLLDSRNRLLAEPAWPGDAEHPRLVREMLRHALAAHASAAILVHDRGDAPAQATVADRALLAAAQEAAGPLSVVVHDLVVTGRGAWTSLRQPRP